MSETERSGEAAFRPVPLTEHEEGRRLEVLGTSWYECFHNEFQFTWMKRLWIRLIGLHNQQQQQQKEKKQQNSVTLIT